MAASSVVVSPPPAGADLPPGGTFADDDGSVHEGAIEAIVAEGITAGCVTTAKRYCPLRQVTRGQMATFLSRALALPAASRDHFRDDDGTTHEDAINRVAEAKITTGDASGRFRPGSAVSRGQMATFLVRALDLPPASLDHFPDDDGSAHEDSINRVAEAGIASGGSDGRYRPGAAVQRDQMASFLARALDLSLVVPPSRALAHGPAAVAAMMSDLTDGGGVGAARAVTTGIANHYTGYVADLVEVAGPYDATSWTEVSPATSAASLGGGRHRLHGLVLDWDRGDGLVDRVTDVVVRTDPNTGRVTVEDFWRSNVPLSWIVRHQGTVSEWDGVVARVRYNFQDVSFNQAPMIVTMEIENRRPYPIAVDIPSLQRDDGIFFSADEFSAPIIDPGQKGLAIAVFYELDLVSHGGTLWMISYGMTDGTEASLSPRLHPWPRR
jgi:hypothetical protein